MSPGCNNSSSHSQLSQEAVYTPSSSNVQGKIRAENSGPFIPKQQDQGLAKLSTSS